MCASTLGNMCHSWSDLTSPYLEWETQLETKKSTPIQHERTCKNTDKCSIVQIAFLNLFGLDVYTV